VQGRRATDIDYHAVYRTADLDANHWWVVGAYHSREEYERSSRDRLAMLVKHGLTPDARVLDVGCGTGQMAGPLTSYLSDRGAYYGTDIGAEAIDFCDRTFQRRNFVFRRGEMTRVPFDTADGPFDLVIFFSVFTHTFVDESALLLAEARRLLRPGGAVIADVITSPLVERGAGHRGEMVVNRDHFFRLADMLGFTGDVIGRWDWNRHAERLMIRFR
jgi:SAM-dependent methyltransferase